MRSAALYRRTATISQSGIGKFVRMERLRWKFGWLITAGVANDSGEKHRWTERSAEGQYESALTILTGSVAWRDGDQFFETWEPLGGGVAIVDGTPVGSGP